MNDVSAYFHALDGRLRIKAAAVKRSQVKAREVESALHAMDGIARVTANPITGNVLVFYDPDRTTQVAIIEALRLLGCLKADHMVVRNEPRGSFLRYQFVQILARSTMEFALQRLITALV